MSRFIPLLLAIILVGCSPAKNISNKKQALKSGHIEKSDGPEPGAYFTRMGQGEAVDFPGHQVLHHVRAEYLPSQISLTELTLAPKMLGAPPHIHQDEDEVFVVLKGKVHFLNGAEEVVGETGTIASLPRGHYHGFWNPYEEPVTMLMVIAPGHFEDFFKDVEQAVQLGGPKSPPEIGAIIANKAAQRDVIVDMSKLPPSALALLGPPQQ